MFRLLRIRRELGGAGRLTEGGESGPERIAPYRPAPSVLGQGDAVAGYAAATESRASLGPPHQLADIADQGFRQTRDLWRVVQAVLILKQPIQRLGLLQYV